MCGIAGVTLRSPGPITANLVQGLSCGVAHRGPDDKGWLSLAHGEIQRGREITTDFWTQALLVHRRLSILDLSERGWQPMSTKNQRYHIVFNGEIYNYRELRRDLEATGSAFHTDSDTEVLLNACAN